MIDYSTKAPGVYIENKPAAGPIAGTGTSVAALIGEVATVTPDFAAKPAVEVTNWAAYVRAFGDYREGLTFPYAVRGFFENGGTRAYVIPVKSPLAAAGLEAAIDQLTRLGDVSLVCLPGVADPALQQLVINHCEAMGDRFAVLDGTADVTAQFADALNEQRGQLDSDLGFGGLYWPWVVIRDPRSTTGAVLNVPPSGHVAGVMARSDDTVGVHKAPANEVLKGAVDVGYPLNDTEQGVLNKSNINAIRVFPGRPPMVWGARTLTTDTAWRYVNVRRLVSYIEDSLLQGLRWAVFEPNNLALWKGLERSITEFLTRVWEAGALFGATAKDAFYVKIDEELNPPSVRQLGQVYVEIGLAPTSPAEYVVLQLGLWDGGAQISEA